MAEVDYRRPAGRRPSPTYENHSPDRRQQPQYSGQPQDYSYNGQSRSGYQGGGGSRADILEKRRLERLHSTVTIWPPSPPRETAKDFEEEKSKKKHHRSSRHHRHHSDSEDYDSEDRDRKKKRKHKSEKKSKRRRYSDSPEPERERERERERHRKRSRSKSEKVQSEGEDEWVVKGADAPSRPLTISNAKAPNTNEESDDEIGPMPPPELSEKAVDARIYGEALRPGEGSAMAAFVSEGKRIPRRGEIGLESHQIEQYERAGYVMSGSRHRRMNAVRMRKENQVITAEEKRGLLKLQQEEKMKREQAIVSSFKELVQDKLQSQQ